jgi:hypothetical protein
MLRDERLLPCVAGVEGGLPANDASVADRRRRGVPYWPAGGSGLRIMGPTGPVTASPLDDRGALGQTAGTIRFASAAASVVALAALATVDRRRRRGRASRRRRPRLRGERLRRARRRRDIGLRPCLRGRVEDLCVPREGSEGRGSDEDPAHQAARAAGHRRGERARLRRLDGHVGPRGRSGPRGANLSRSKVTARGATAKPGYSGAPCVCTSAFSRAFGRGAS